MLTNKDKNDNWFLFSATADNIQDILKDIFEIADAPEMGKFSQRIIDCSVKYWLANIVKAQQYLSYISNDNDND